MIFYELCSFRDAQKWDKFCSVCTKYWKTSNFIWIPFSVLQNFGLWLKLFILRFDDCCWASWPWTCTCITVLPLVCGYLSTVFVFVFCICICILNLYFNCICEMISDLGLRQYYLPLFDAEQPALFSAFWSTSFSKQSFFVTIHCIVYMALHCIVYSQHQNVPHLTKISLRIKNYSHLTLVEWTRVTLFAAKETALFAK